MKAYNEVLTLLQEQTFTMTVDEISISDALGRVLAEDILADADQPPFDRSAMDGFACRKADLSGNLVVIEEIPAGKMPKKEIVSGTASKIMTGAMIPHGADWVIRVEDTSMIDDGTVKILDKGKISNIRLRGEDIGKGDILIKKGTVISRQHIGNFASVGKTSIMVNARPRVGMINTGSEIIDPQHEPGPSQIRNSNGPQLLAQLRMLGIEGKDYGIIHDDEDKILEIISRAASECDVVLITGGVSAGEYDFIPGILDDLNFNILFHKMKVRPGKPLLFAKNEQTFVFGIPGNPVSTLVQFEVVIRRFLLQLMGAAKADNFVKMPVGDDIGNKTTFLRIFLPVKFVNGEAFPIPYHGSGHLSAWAAADGILEIPEDNPPILKGEIAYVRPF
jgi:molybdopterin molybdotransferase